MNKELFDFTISKNNKEIIKVSLELNSINILFSKNNKKTSYLLQYMSGIKNNKNIEIKTDSSKNVFYVNKDMICVQFLSIYENLKLVASDESSINEVISFTELNGYENYTPVSSNSGLKLRLALAKALLLKSEIIIFDNCIKYIDYQDQIYFLSLINKLKEQHTFLIASDIPLFYEELDNIIFLMENNVVNYNLLKSETNFYEIIKKYNIS